MPPGVAPSPGVSPHYGPAYHSGVPWQNAQKANAPSSVKATQLWLKAHGFALPITGMRDKLTMSAIQAWHTGVRNGASWSKANGLVHLPAAHPGNQTPQHITPHAGTVAANPNSTVHVSPTGPGVPSTPSPTSIPGLPTTNPIMQVQHVDPNKYAASQVAVKYAPVIDQITSQRDALTQGLKQGLANIDQWYGGAQQQAATGAAQNAQVGQEGIQSIQDVAKSLAGAYGGSADAAANQSVATKALGDVGLLTAQKNNQSAIDAAMQTGIGTAGAGAKNAYTNLNNQRVNAFNTQLDTESQQAAADAANFINQAMQMNDSFANSAEQRRASELSQKLSEELAGPQVTAANLANQATEQNMGLNADKQTLAHQQFNAQQSQNNINNSQNQQRINLSKWEARQQVKIANFNKTLAAKSAAAQAKGQTFTQLIRDPSFKTALNGSLGSQMFKPNAVGAPVLGVNPQQAYAQVFSQLRQSYPHADPAVLKNYASTLVVTWRNNAGGQWGYWSWNGGKFVNTRPGHTPSGDKTGKK